MTLHPAESTYAVAVVGAGPAGSVAALALARAGVRVVLLDLGPRARIDVGECLPPAARSLLARAGVWSEFRRSGPLPSLGIRSAWGAPLLVERDFLFSPYGCGWHIDRERLDRALVRAAVASGAAHRAAVTLRAVERDGDRRWRLILSRGGEAISVSASFVIEASGRAAVFAGQAGARRLQVDRLVGVAGHVAPGVDAAVLDRVLLVEAVRDGWWYTAPRPGGGLAAVYMSDADTVVANGVDQPDGWRAQLDATLHTRRRVEAHGGRVGAPLGTVAADSVRLERAAGPGWLAVGDAAAAFDPVSSRGVAAAIEGGFEAARATRQWLVGDDEAVETYADRCARDYAAYLLNRKAAYALERRWPDAPFWRLRHRDDAPAVASPEPILSPASEAVASLGWGATA